MNSETGSDRGNGLSWYGDSSLKSRDKLKLKSEFEWVREKGVKWVGRHMLLIVAPASDNRRRAGVVCGRKFSKRAVDRNRARRLIRESFRTFKARVATVHMVFIPRRTIQFIRVQETRRDMLGLLKKSELWVEMEQEQGKSGDRGQALSPRS